MKTFTATMMVTGILLFSMDAVKAQEGISYLFEQNRSAFAALEARVSDRGMTPEEFGAWLAESSGIYIHADDRRSDPGPAFPMGYARIDIFLIDVGGIVGRNSMPVRLPDGSSSLSSRVDGNQFGRFIKNTATSQPARWYPDPESWHQKPEDRSPIESSRDLQRIASDAGRRAIGSGGAAGKASLVMIITPDADRYDVPVTPGVVVFTFDLRD